MVTDLETSSAMSSVHFRWNWGMRLTRQISSLLRTVRPQSSPRSGREREIGVTSAPQLSGRRRKHKSKESVSASAQEHRSGSRTRRDKGKARADAPKRPSSAPKPTAGRSKSIERWPMSREKASANASTIEGKTPKVRRGSETLLAPARVFHDGSSPASSRSEIRRSRFPVNISSIWHWRPNKYSPGPSPVEVSPSASSILPNEYSPSSLSPTDVPSLDPFGRRSEEALRHHRSGRSSSSGPLTAARRASSWGENPGDFVEVTSLNSDEHDVDDQAMILGAGGVSNDPILIRTPSVGFGSAAEAVSSGSTSNVPLALRQPQPERFFLGHSIPPTPDPAMHDTSYIRIGQSRAINASPLTQVAYDSAIDNSREQRTTDEFDDFSSFDDSLEEVCEEPQDEDDDDDSDSDEVVIPLEVRRRGPASPPPRSPESDDERS